jgi:hypothetical protein
LDAMVRVLKTRTAHNHLSIRGLNSFWEFILYYTTYHREAIVKFNDEWWIMKKKSDFFTGQESKI